MHINMRELTWRRNLTFVQLASLKHLNHIHLTRKHYTTSSYSTNVHNKNAIRKGLYNHTFHQGLYLNSWRASSINKNTDPNIYVESVDNLIETMLPEVLVPLSRAAHFFIETEEEFEVNNQKLPYYN